MEFIGGGRNRFCVLMSLRPLPQKGPISEVRGKRVLRSSRLTLRRCGKMKLVHILSRLFRFTAMFLLLFMAAEVLACDLLQSDDCYISAKITSQNRDHGVPPQPSGDTCLCCCTHMAISVAITFNPESSVSPAPAVDYILRPLFMPSGIDHPPQLA